jgi:hypothetical protein
VDDRVPSECRDLAPAGARACLRAVLTWCALARDSTRLGRVRDWPAQQVRLLNWHPVGHASVRDCPFHPRTDGIVLRQASRLTTPQRLNINSGSLNEDNFSLQLNSIRCRPTAAVCIIINEPIPWQPFSKIGSVPPLKMRMDSFLLPTIAISGLANRLCYPHLGGTNRRLPDTPPAVKANSITIGVSNSDSISYWSRSNAQLAL